MFLKRIELAGFKSFAEKTVLLMEDGITGIVGPNGCGKSNINDAIRWVLGEQSSKSLRSGTSMSDIIFSGSQSRKPVSLARVTLVFDNSAHIFDSPFQEIEITREISRDGSTNCYINKSPCRLKDISDLVMDTGLGRDSLSIITQGNISSFADARPVDRRQIFEEAAGVARYKKRKKTSLAKLENMNANLERVQDLIDNLQEQKESLQEQAAKAREYIETRDQLAAIEISVLAIQIEDYHQKLEDLSSKLEAAVLEEGSANLSLKEKEELLEQIQKELFSLDGQLASLQEEYSRSMEESYSLQKRKVELDEKRKYALEQADAKLKIASLQEMAAEAKYEVEDRQNRLSQLKNSQGLLGQQISALQREQRQLEEDRNREQSLLQSWQNRKVVLENRVQAPYAHRQGIQSILNARASLDGIEGLVSELLEAKEGYEQAIQTALGSAAEQIATRDDECARRAIGFLKQSRAGRATFLPLTVCKPRNLYPQQEIIAMQEAGYLGVAAAFVQCHSRYENLKGRLLGNILVFDNLEHANAAAKRLKHQVKIVTPEGDVIHSGGAMSGGSSKNNSSVAAMKVQLRELNADIEKKSQSLQRIAHALMRKEQQRKQLEEQALQVKIDAEKLQAIVDVKREKYNALKDELASLSQNLQEENTDVSDSLVASISRLHEKMDSLSSDISLKRGRRAALSEEQESLQQDIRQIRRNLSSLSSAIHKDQLEKTRLETKMEQSLMRLNGEYSLTYEAAAAQKQEVDLEAGLASIKNLRLKLNKLGDVNLQAPAMYEEVLEKYEFLTSQKAELEQAADQIKKAIAQMDETMATQFKDMFDRINKELDGIFKAMFNGGKASLFLEDPNDLLNTGIDIDVQPPGKTVKNIQTFSGGEKALIAISVLFAILKARTMPLCIFDEVEAALDQANVERFARYLSHFKDQSQFVVVTHRPGTMEQCDTLYGITMQKDGVSTVLKVLLQDALSLFPQRKTGE